jgi:hypothetical protein
MNGSVIVWDLETVPDLGGFAATPTKAEIGEVGADWHRHDDLEATLSRW